MRFDIVCRVVDNYGDAGVTLRLARTLAAEHDATVALWIDDRASLARIAPGLDSRATDAMHDGVRIRAFDPGTVPAALPDVIVEAFGCGLPESWLDAMQAAPRPPVWVNLEYLSAEDWVDGAHGLPSRHPTRPLTRWFYFPGFTARTGGLLRERSVAEVRDACVRESAARAMPWISLGLEPPPSGALALTLFCYPNDALPALFDAWANDEMRTACLVPEGVAAAAIGRLLRGAPPSAGTVARAGNLTLAVAPFVHQAAFDRRLWCGDFNVVRGEDSLVRALWAARPMAWHAYPQPEGAHRAKLAAFAGRYGASLDAGALAVWRAFQDAFNDGDGPATAAAWAPLRRALPVIAEHARRFAAELARLPDLASQLVDFCRLRL
jgi:uncharacterized repeat protein (TIGR03837 family)